MSKRDLLYEDDLCDGDVLWAEDFDAVATPLCPKCGGQADRFKYGICPACRIADPNPRESGLITRLIAESEVSDFIAQRSRHGS